MTDRWKPLSNSELEKIQWGLQGEQFDPAKGGWYEPNQQMIDQVNGFSLCSPILRPERFLMAEARSAGAQKFLVKLREFFSHHTSA
jgi:hypothetical protein